MTVDNLLSGPASATALIDGDSSLTYQSLRDSAQAMRRVARGIVMLRIENTLPAIETYAACVDGGHPVLLIDRDATHEYVEDLAARYRPAAIANVPFDVHGFSRTEAPHAPIDWQAADGQAADAHPDLALLLTTSGSTGSPKLVRLSRTAVLSNAESIADGLGIGETERAITSLPPSYTYGLSVINSHLIRGASLILTNESVVAQPFWREVTQFGATSFAGVPTTYRMLKQMRWDAAQYPSLRYLTQAGGRLSDELREHFLDMTERLGAKFFVMYGQTEATARMTITRPELLRMEISTAGEPVSGGSLSIVNADEHGEGEVVYSGPNVMMGYAENVSDLSRGDDLGGVLATGDLGYLCDGALFITGRSKRIVKIFGVRVSLDDIDRWLASRVNGTAVQGEDRVDVFVQAPLEDPESLRSELSSYIRVHPSGVRVHTVDEIPLLSSGKINYQALRSAVRT
ncbi:AMP-binding protein [Humibacter antri]